MALSEELSRVLRLRDMKEKEEAYKACVTSALRERSVSSVVEVVRHLLEKEALDQTGRTYTCPTVLGFIIDAVGRAPDDEEEDAKAEEGACPRPSSLLPRSNLPRSRR